MTQEEKELLLKDLAARVPYDIMVEQTLFPPSLADREQRLKSVQVNNVVQLYWYKYINEFVPIHCIKPYLRPLSSMTKEEKEDLLITLLGKDGSKYFQVLPDGSIDNNDAVHQSISNFNIHWINFDVVNTSIYIEWLNKHHFDYHGLIEKGLALKAPEGMYK